MDPDPLRLLETAHPLRSGSISQGSPKPRFAIRPNCRLKRPSKLVNKTVNNFIKFVDGPTQMSRRRARSRILQTREALRLRLTPKIEDEYPRKPGLFWVRHEHCRE